MRSRLSVVDTLREIEELHSILIYDYEFRGSVNYAARVAMDAVSEMAMHVLTRSEVGAIDAMVDGEERAEAKAYDGIRRYRLEVSL